VWFSSCLALALKLEPLQSSSRSQPKPTGVGNQWLAKTALQKKLEAHAWKEFSVTWKDNRDLLPDKCRKHRWL
jgi:hypothetical protein